MNLLNLQKNVGINVEGLDLTKYITKDPKVVPLRSDLLLFDFSTTEALNDFFLPFLEFLAPYVGKEENPMFDTEVPLRIVRYLKIICMRIMVEFPNHTKIMKESFLELDDCEKILKHYKEIDLEMKGNPNEPKWKKNSTAANAGESIPM